MSDAGAVVAMLPHDSEDTEDPDTHATLREFVDYTEYLPSDLFRSLQLIRSLDAQEADHRGHLEWLTKEFASLHAPLPATNGFGRAVSDEEMEMRLQISRSINASVRTRQESAAEATKLHQNIDRHFSRINAIRKKLDHVTIPSRDPTPVSPRKPRALEKSEDPHYRITLRLNSDRTPAPSSARGGRRRAYPAAPRSRLPPVTPAGNEDDWEDIPDSVYPPKPKKKKHPMTAPKRGPKPPTDPPFSGGAPARDENGVPIPAHLLPWNRLTNEELARLRKRMKKNSGWTPSVTMIIRELETLGRGPKHKDAFSEQTEGRLGEEFLKIYGPEDGGIGDPEKIAPDDGAGVRENKGMRLNRAKKRKREEERKEKEREAERERCEAEAEAERERLRRAAEEEERKEKERKEKERKEKERIARERAAHEAAAAREAEEAREAAEAAEKERLVKEAREKAREKKEKERATAAIAASSRKMRSASISTVNTANTGSTATTTSNSNSASTEADEAEDEEMPDADAPPPRRLGRPPKNPPAFKAGHKRAASATMPAGTPSAENKRSKRVSTADATPAPRTKPTARKKGLVAGGRRRTVKSGEGAAGAEMAGSEQEWVDEDEEDLNRYCLCNEVSRGTMVACENSQCPKVWFHIECVGLKEEEATTKLKWFCPICSEDMPGKRGGKRRKKV